MNFPKNVALGETWQPLLFFQPDWSVRSVWSLSKGGSISESEISCLESWWCSAVLLASSTVSSLWLLGSSEMTVSQSWNWCSSCGTGEKNCEPLGGLLKNSFKCCGKIYEGKKTCLVNRYRYQKEKKQTGTDIMTASIDPRRTVTTIHTGVTPLWVVCSQSSWLRSPVLFHSGITPWTWIQYIVHGSNWDNISELCLVSMWMT